MGTECEKQDKELFCDLVIETIVKQNHVFHFWYNYEERY